MTNTDNISICLNPTEFFREKITQAINRQKTDIALESEFYLVNLLCQFIKPPVVATSKGNVNPLQMPLALLLHEAHSSEGLQQYALFKSLADTSLYLSGFFQNYFNRKCFDIDYFITLGKNAYGTLAELKREHKEKNLVLLYQDFADEFATFVEIVAEVKDSTCSDEKVDIIGTYNHWLTKQDSTRLCEKLTKNDIIPVVSNKKIKH